MPAFLPEAPLISQELVNPIISHFALLAENSANVPKRLCSLVMKKQNKTEQNKQQQKTLLLYPPQYCCHWVRRNTPRPLGYI